MIDWGNILKEIGIVGLITAAVTWLFKSLGENFIVEDLSSLRRNWKPRPTTIDLLWTRT
jgi:hypothetical protein